MNKIPKCLTRNSIPRHYLKLTKKISKNNRLLNNNKQKRDKSLNSTKNFSKDTTAYSLISTKKPSILTTTSSKKNSLISNKNVIYI